MPRLRRLLIPLAVLFCIPVAGASAQAPAGGGGGGGGGSSSNCPSFQVLHNDRIGSLQLPAGAYRITINTPQTLTCAQAADLFRQFLQDFDGRLPGGWQVDASTATFSRTSPRRQSFSVARTGAQPSDGTTVVQPNLAGGSCPATFQVLHDDRIGALRIPAGHYRLNLVSDRMTCDQAATALASFLQDYNGRLPRPWFIDSETGTFLRGTINVGFWIEPVATPLDTVLRLPGDGTPCPGTFQVLHNDRIGGLRVPRGHYLFVPLARSNLSCRRIVTLLRQFLEQAGDEMPGRWVVASKKTGTFTNGRGSRVGFRIKRLSA